MSSDKKLFFVFDVESVGLHGEGFAVGYVVVDLEGNQHDAGAYACPFNAARGGEEDFEWCRKNIPSLAVTHSAPWLVRSAFWQKWLEWKERAAMVADCAWPVEARFLAQCVDDRPMDRVWGGPYPLHDLASVLLARGYDPAGEYGRLKEELPRHDPLSDAKQSARVLVEALTGKLQAQADQLPVGGVAAVNGN